MLDYVKRIAFVEQEKRRNGLISILKENDLPFIIQREKQNNHWVENIIISINPSNHRLVIGAHYDSVDGSSGANDNAAAVSILIQLAKQLVGKTKRSIDVVFFDREEYEDHGSDAYITYTGKSNIAAMVNLDMCGFGNTISVAAKGNIGNGHFGNILMPDMIKKHEVFTLGFMPNGDDARFTQNNIPNISVAMLPKSNAEFFESVANMIANGEAITKDVQNQFKELEVVATMHNAPNDNIDCVSEKSMELLYKYLLDGLILQ
jgi:hypothetical protein